MFFWARAYAVAAASLELVGQRHHEFAGIAVVPSAVEVHLRIVFLVEQIVDVELEGGRLRHQIGDRVAGEVRASLHERAAAVGTPIVAHEPLCHRTPPLTVRFRREPEKAYVVNRLKVFRGKAVLSFARRAETGLLFFKSHERH